MDISSLRQTLLEAYTVKNLNKISLTLINLYKEKQFGILQKIADIISELVFIEMGENGKGFYKFMMLYHPDRSEVHCREINRLADTSDFDRLLGYTHILKLERIEEIAGSLDSYEDIDYSPVYEWDVSTEGFRTFTDSDEDEDEVDNEPSGSDRQNKGFSLYDAVKMRMYGDTEIEYPTYYLEDWEEFELSASEINDLDGIQYCVHVKNFDLSDNNIHDLTLLSTLIALEELNLADNNIRYIDAIGYLKNLHSVNLSNNRIEDIGPLFRLENLEFADLAGNKISASQLKSLQEAGVTINV
jgi:Leucine-rich repeat (LRR) protein